MRKKVLLGIMAVASLLTGCSNNPATQSTPSSSSRTQAASTAPSSADEAIKALRKIEAATQVGVTYQQYRDLLIDAKAKVNEATATTHSPEFKSELNAAMDAYDDAGTAWGDMLEYDFMETEYEPWHTIQQKYSIPEDHSNQMSKGASRQTVLNTIWAAASAHLNRASEAMWKVW
jgi:hypothetical protein